MTDVKFYDREDVEVEIEEETHIVYIRVRDAVGLLWEANPKRHDFGSLIESIVEYGFQNPPKYDETLGAIKTGNGRIEALKMMENSGYAIPRGIGKLDDGSWLMPLSIGVDALDALEAQAYALEDNNMPLAGGDFTPIDMSRMYDPGAYRGLLENLAMLDRIPLTVGEEGLDLLLMSIGQDGETAEEQEERIKEGGIRCPKCGFVF